MTPERFAMCLMVWGCSSAVTLVVLFEFSSHSVWSAAVASVLVGGGAAVAAGAVQEALS